LYSSTNIIRQIKSKRMKWAGHVARMGEERKVYRVLVGKPEGKRQFGRPSVDGRIGSELMLGRLAEECGLDPGGSGHGPLELSFEYGNELSGSGATELVT
jgi:hypothetical protein